MKGNKTTSEKLFLTISGMSRTWDRYKNQEGGYSYDKGDHTRQ
jgi:hypothetical protein